MDIRKLLIRRRPRLSDNPKLGYFTLLINVVLPRTAKKCTKIYNARAQLLLSSLNILFRYVLFAVVVVACLSSLIFFWQNLNSRLESKTGATFVDMSAYVADSTERLFLTCVNTLRTYRDPSKHRLLFVSPIKRYERVYRLPIIYLTIILRARVGYEMIDSQRGAWRRVGYNHLRSNKRE